MKTIGMIAGVTWHSSVKYYQAINTAIHKHLGGVHSAKIMMNSVDFAEIEDFQERGEWGNVGRLLIDAAKSLELAGADFILICANTLHKFAEVIQKEITIPILHIADATALAIKKQSLKKVGLLGTIYTMEEPFYKDKLNEHNLDVILPSPEDRKIISDIIYNELVIGKVSDSSRDEYWRIMKEMVGRGAQGIILGCTEIGLLIRDEDIDIPLFETMSIHALAAVDSALK